ncbi:MAG: hypothetical protein GY859_29425, partial [Desulfobacterales bacterium]|nr:hypothetical protein [Desulfobacterales bacterium]
IVRDNTFRYIRSPADDVAEHAVHFWSNSENTLVERNVIINCDRGIGFGMGDRGHVGGIIRNNMIYHDASEGFADVSIGLERAPGAQIYNNTIYQEHAYPNAIEYRWPETTGVLIANNLTNAAISARDNASANVSANVTQALASWFVNASSGDLHLAHQEPLVVDQGQSVSGLVDDFDLDARSGAVDIGADEVQSEEQNAPSAPVLAIDIDGLNVTFSWPHVANADSYMFYYVTFPDGEIAGSFEYPSTSLTVSLWSGLGLGCAVRAQNAV